MPKHPHDRGQAGTWALLGVLALVLAGVVLLAVSLNERERTAAGNKHVLPAPATVTLAVERNRPGRAVPPHFLGLSFEVSDLAMISSYSGRGDLTRLLRSLGPGVIRFGGISADSRTAWTDARDPRPSWASKTIDPEDLRRLRVLAQASGWQVLLTVGLAHYNPSSAARETAAARSILGPWLLAIEIGNEPDSYARHGFRTQPWRFGRYSTEVTAYRRAIGRLAPGVALAGPDVSGSKIFTIWGPREALIQRPALITGHHYPMGCRGRSAPSIGRLLSPRTRSRERLSLERYMRIARSAHLPLRIDETNSVSCGGVAGVSDTFAAALWATSYITTAMSEGVAGINLEGNPARCTGYSLLCASTPSRLAAGDLQAQPEWYALLLTRELIGDRPLASRITQRAGANITASALLAPGGAVKVVIVDDEPPGSGVTRASLDVGAGLHSADAVSLRASSPAALAGTSLGGSTVSASGSWAGPADATALAVNSGEVSMALAPSSATLVTIRP
jgi:hypothetical protein